MNQPDTIGFSPSVFSDADAFVRAVGDHLAFAHTPAQLAEQVRDTLRAIVNNAHFLEAGADQHLIDLAVRRLSQAAEPLRIHLADEVPGTEVDIGLRCAVTIIRNFARPGEAADPASKFNLAMWFDSVAYLANAMTNAFLVQRMEARMRAHGQRSVLGRLETATAPSTMH